MEFSFILFCFFMGLRLKGSLVEKDKQTNYVTVMYKFRKPSFFWGKTFWANKIQAFYVINQSYLPELGRQPVM